MVKRILTVPVINIEKKSVNKPGSPYDRKVYYLISFTTGGMKNMRVRKATAMVPDDPTAAALVMKFYDDQIASKQFLPLQGSYFMIGDKSLDPNTVELPMYRSKRSDGTFGSPQNSMEVFVLYDPEEDRYEMSPQKKALSIVHNPDLCEIVHDDRSAEHAQSGSDPLAG